MHVRPVERVGLVYRPAEVTGELWWSEGVTIYFSDLLRRRAQLPVSNQTRVRQVERLIETYLFTPGYSRISAERGSLASGDPLALGDDSVSTHRQGEILGTMLDLMIRDATHGQRSLDTVMRKLSERFTPQRGIIGSDIERAVRDVCGCDTQAFFEAYVRGARPMDFERYLRGIGLRPQVSWGPALSGDGKPEPDLRVFAFNTEADSALKLRITNPESAWGRAGLHTGDRLVSVDGRPVATTAEFRSWLGKLHIGDTARVEVMRDGKVSLVSVLISQYNRPTVRLEEIANAGSEQLKLRALWLAAAP